MQLVANGSIKQKKNNDGSIARYKERIMAKVFINDLALIFMKPLVFCLNPLPFRLFLLWLCIMVGLCAN